MITEEERRVYGPLGKIPDVVVHGPAGSGQKWIELTEKARAAMRTRNKEERILKAKRVEHEYKSLIEECERYLNRKRS